LACALQIGKTLADATKTFVPKSKYGNVVISQEPAAAKAKLRKQKDVVSVQSATHTLRKIARKIWIPDVKRVQT
jgi:hypothetical protein